MKTIHWCVALALLALVGCGDDGGSGAAGGGGSTAGAPEGGSGDGGEAEGGGGADGGAPAGGGGAGEGGAGGGPTGELTPCESPLSCVDAAQYFCDEISGPDDGGAFETECTRMGGTFSEGPCVTEMTSWSSACQHDCITPTTYSIIGTDQQACEEAGGTYLEL